METQLNEVLRSHEVTSATEVPSIPKETGDGIDSSAVTKKLEEELKKRDALIEVCFSQNTLILKYCDL